MRTTDKRCLWTILLLASLILICTNAPVSAQTTRYLVTSNGDSLAYSWPPPDSAYVHDHVLVKFHPGALQLSMLCYSYGSSDSLGLDTTIRMAVMAQRFYLDSGIIANPTLRQELTAFGGEYLQRITSANPCVDTFSIARDGDTLAMDHFNWMVLKIRDTTRILGIVDSMAGAPSGMVESASLDHIGLLLDRQPRDVEYLGAPQRSLQLIGVENPWSTQTGNRGIKIGVIDDGIDWRHCDLGGGKSPGHKITGGWNFAENNPDFTYGAEHGTKVTGVLGAVTENTDCINHSTYTGVAGIAGGWVSEGKLGCQVMGFRAIYDVGTAATHKVLVGKATAAILEGAANRPMYWDGTRMVPPYGYGVHILNNSWGVIGADHALRNAVNFAFEQRVSVVAARCNTNSTAAEYPAMFDPQWVTAVSAGDRFKNRMNTYSSYGLTTDLLAPGGTTAPNDPNRIVRTTQHLAWGGGYTWFNGTSAAAPHVSGVLGLLHSEALDRFYANQNGWILFPQDYEGMLKASAEDRNESDLSLGQGPGYDDHTAWGHLRADNLFNMLNAGYVIPRYTITPTSANAGPWSTYYGTLSTIRANGGLRHNIPKGLTPGYYYKVRQITATYTVPDIFDLTLGRMFVWGYSGRFGGWGLAGDELYQTSYTQVTSGTGGNARNEGIIHSHSRTVTMRTYQYEFFDPLNGLVSLGVFPSISNCRMHISVFAKLKPGTRPDDRGDATSGFEEVDEAGAKASHGMAIRPNPSQGNITIDYRISAPGPVGIFVTNQYGTVVRTISQIDSGEGPQSIALDMRSAEPGVYICTVVSGETRMSRTFMVVR